MNEQKEDRVRELLVAQMEQLRRFADMLETYGAAATDCTVRDLVEDMCDIGDRILARDQHNWEVQRFLMNRHDRTSRGEALNVT